MTRLARLLQGCVGILGFTVALRNLQDHVQGRFEPLMQRLPRSIG